MPPKVELIPLDINNPDHVGSMFKVRTNPEVAQYMIGTPPASFLQHIQYLYDVKHKQFQIIQFMDAPVGYCQSTMKEDEIELGWAVHPHFWGQGIGSIVVGLLVKKMMPLKKNLILYVKKSNARALHLYKKHHFIIETNFEHHEQFKMKYDPPT